MAFCLILLFRLSWLFCIAKLFKLSSHVSYSIISCSTLSSSFSLFNEPVKEFVDSKIPWVHFDIAGTAWGVKPDSVNPKGSATGVGVRLVLDMFGV